MLSKQNITNVKMSEENDSKYEIIQNADGKFEASMPISRKFHRSLIGYKGKSRQLIESKTETTIKIPHGKHDENIQLTGSSRSSVELAMSEINEIVAQHQLRPLSLTHFLSIPINDKGIVEKFIEFKNQVSLSNEDFPDALFQKTYKLHLTLGVLTLSTDEEKNLAITTLQESREIIENAKIRFNNSGDLRIQILGVNCMNNNPSKCCVLYGVVENEMVQTIADEIVGRFIAKGLMQKERNHVKLHVTMMNVAFARRKKAKYARTFDASSTIEKFLNFEFGEQKIDELHLSLFGTNEAAAYYKSDGILNIS